ncbi:hypothetical protein BD311DRAFT_247895 [Dichomitus squalens]|uniref:Uncharacterized protein n=1 Tax=Dichomitus squalens TaxID=114155 RepID=A0A4Q9MRW2_9APHY|nr:hypothetical protein BD311DRAFT_247895 [Dichomitus squalens]
MMQVSPSIALHRYQKPWSPPPFASLARPLTILVRLCPLTPAFTTESRCMGHISRAACRICPCINRAIPCAIAVPLAKRPNLAYKNIQARSCSPAAQRRASFLPTQSAELPAHRAVPVYTSAPASGTPPRCSSLLPDDPPALGRLSHSLVRDAVHSQNITYSPHK